MGNVLPIVSPNKLSGLRWDNNAKNIIKPFRASDILPDLTHFFAQDEYFSHFFRKLGGTSLTFPHVLVPS